MDQLRSHEADVGRGEHQQRLHLPGAVRVRGDEADGRAAQHADHEAAEDDEDELETDEDDVEGGDGGQLGHAEHRVVEHHRHPVIQQRLPEHQEVELSVHTDLLENR